MKSEIAKANLLKRLMNGYVLGSLGAVSAFSVDFVFFGATLLHALGATSLMVAFVGVQVLVGKSLHSWWDSFLRDKFTDGFDNGRTVGKEEGYKSGYEQAKADIKPEVVFMDPTPQALEQANKMLLDADLKTFEIEQKAKIAAQEILRLAEERASQIGLDLVAKANQQAQAIIAKAQTRTQEIILAAEVEAKEIIRIAQTRELLDELFPGVSEYSDFSRSPSPSYSSDSDELYVPEEDTRDAADAALAVGIPEAIVTPRISPRINKGVPPKSVYDEVTSKPRV